MRGEDDTEAFVDHLDDDDERHGLTDEELAAAYQRALDARQSQQREWSAVQSNLALAFAELNQIGVLARGNFTCCGTAPPPRSTTSLTSPGIGTDTSGITNKTPSH